MTGPARRWVFPDGWMPPHGDGVVDGHEAICLINLGSTDADLTLTFYFEDAPPQSVAGLRCNAQRTRHFRLDRPDELLGYQLPDSTPYALLVDSSVPVVAQHTRVDTRSPALGLLTTIGVPVNGELS